MAYSGWDVEASAILANLSCTPVFHEKIFQVGLLACVAILLIGILFSIATYKNDKEDDYVDTSKYQAVFLNGGQVYFGKITALNPEYLTLSNIYYLRVDQQVQPDQEEQQNNNFTLAKLGCELHRPQDVMVISKDQVVFWENLKDEGGENTVPGAIKQFTDSGAPQNCDEPQQPAATGSNNAADANNGATSNVPAPTNNTPAAANNEDDN